MKRYEKPSMEIVELSKENAIVTSGCSPVNQCSGLFTFCGEHSCSTDEPR